MPGGPTGLGSKGVPPGVWWVFRVGRRQVVAAKGRSLAAFVPVVSLSTGRGGDVDARRGSSLVAVARDVGHASPVWAYDLHVDGDHGAVGGCVLACACGLQCHVEVGVGAVWSGVECVGSHQDTFTTPVASLFGDGKIHVKLPASRNGWFTGTVARARAADKTFLRITPHDLRHTAALLAVQAGAHVKAVQRILGHASAAMTLDTYADLFDDDLDAVAAALDQARRSANVATLLP